MLLIRFMPSGIDFGEGHSEGIVDGVPGHATG